MRFMIMVRATPISEAGALMPDFDTVLAEMDAFHKELAEAGVLLDGAGLRPSREGWRQHYPGDGKPARVVDGPFAETKELIAGYTLIQVRSREEAMEWARRFPAPFGRHYESEVEVRPLYEAEDFEPGGALSPVKKEG